MFHRTGFRCCSIRIQVREFVKWSILISSFKEHASLHEHNYQFTESDAEDLFQLMRDIHSQYSGSAIDIKTINRYTIDAFLRYWEMKHKPLQSLPIELRRTLLDSRTNLYNQIYTDQTI